MNFVGLFVLIGLTLSDDLGDAVFSFTTIAVEGENPRVVFGLVGILLLSSGGVVPPTNLFSLLNIFCS